jgi:hypothetical protein
MHTEILTPAQITVLERLTPLAEVPPFYLAGGTSLGLRYGHRRSIDFDFFRPDAFDGDGLVRALDGAFAHVESLPSGPNTVHVRLEGVSASFFRLPYPLLERPEPTDWGFGLAADGDVAAMKLEAIAGRGSRKDFVDLRTLCRSGLTLEQVCALFERKYGTTRSDLYHRLRALAYFDDAERQPMPDMVVPFDWEEAKRFFRTEAQRLLAAGTAGV